MAIEGRNGGRRGWRIAGWGLLGGLLLLPLAAMQFTNEVNWSPADFVVMGVLLGSVGLGFELAARMSRNLAYRAAAGMAVLSAFFLVWINLAVGIIGNEGNPANLMFGGVLAVAIGGALIAHFRAGGMALAMTATAAAQALVGILALRASPDIEGPVRPAPIVGLTIIFVGGWLVSAWLFRSAARAQSTAGAAR